MLPVRFAAAIVAALVASLTQAEPTKLDSLGDSLPAGAIARLGSMRFLHEDWPRNLTFFRNGKSLLAAGQGGDTRIWNVADGRELRRLSPDSQLNCAVLSPDEKSIAMFGNGDDIVICEAETGKEFRRLTALKQRVSSLAWSPQSDLLAAATNSARSAEDGTIVIWDIKTGTKQKQITGHTGPIRVIALSPDGTTIASAGQDNTLRLWNVADAKELRRLEGETGFIPALTWSPDGRLIAGTCEIRHMGGSRSSARIWEVASGKMLHEIPGSFNCAAFSPDQKALVIGGLADVRIFDPANGKELKRVPDQFQHVYALAFSRDGSMLATSGVESRVRLWDTKTWTEIRPQPGHRGPVQAIAYGPDGRTLITGGLDQSIRYWDWPAGKEVRKADGLGTHWGILALARSSDGKRLISYEHDDLNGPYRVWDSANGRQLGRFGARTGGTRAVAFTPDGKRVLTGHWDGSIGVWDASTFSLEKKVGKVKGQIVSLAALPDGERVVWAGENQTLGLRNLSDGKDVRTFPGSTHHMIAGLALSPDGSTLAIVDGNNPVRLWNVETGKSRGGWSPDIRYLQAAVFSPDGRLLAVGGHEGVQVWDVVTRQKFPPWRGHQKEVKALAFSPDGMTLASAGVDGMVYVWDLTGRLADGRLVAHSVNPVDLEAAWKALAGDDPWAAHRSMWTLVAAAPGSVAWIADRVKPIRKADKDRMTKLVLSLDHEVFGEREKAEKELAAMGEAALETLREALRASPSAEKQRRLERLLKDFDDATLSGPRLRALRAVAALEHIGTTAAREAIIELVEGQVDARLTLEAKAALARLTTRGAKQ